MFFVVDKTKQGTTKITSSGDGSPPSKTLLNMLPVLPARWQQLGVSPSIQDLLPPRGRDARGDGADGHGRDVVVLGVDDLHHHRLGVRGQGAQELVGQIGHVEQRRGHEVATDHPP